MDAWIRTSVSSINLVLKASSVSTTREATDVSIVISPVMVVMLMVLTTVSNVQRDILSRTTSVLQIRLLQKMMRMIMMMVTPPRKMNFSIWKISKNRNKQHGTVIFSFYFFLIFFC